MEGKLVIEHLEDGQVVERLVSIHPISEVGENHVIDCEIAPGNPGPYTIPASGSLSQFKLEQLRTLTFSDGECQAVIDFGDGLVTYSGDLPVDETAKLLFEAVFRKLTPRCETCRWYDSEESKWRMCSCPKMLYGYRHPIDFPDDHLLIEDDEGWGMIPGPDFGCIHHEEKSCLTTTDQKT